MHNYLIASLMCCTCPQTRFILLYTEQLVHIEGAWVAMAMFILALSNITKLENKHTYNNYVKYSSGSIRNDVHNDVHNVILNVHTHVVYSSGRFFTLLTVFTPSTSSFRR